MAQVLAKCATKVDLDPAQILWLLDRPTAAHSLIDIPCCELEDGHDEPHAAMGQQCDDLEWWIRWERAAPWIVPAQLCPADDEAEVCILFAGHLGHHSFELQLPSPWR
mgnify:CR=1 FL=1